MGAIAIQQKQYTIYVLSSPETNSSLEVVPERGGIITRWQVEGQDILYLDQARFADPTLSVRGGIPILFPICGNLPDNTYTHQGQTYTLKQHGFARDQAWQVIDQKTEGELALTLKLGSNAQTLSVYPFEFELVFTYTLAGHDLILHQRYTNLSDQFLPFSAGFHPYFGVTDKSQLQFAIPGQQFQDQRAKTTHPFSGTFDFQQDEIDVAFAGLSQPAACVTDSGRSLQLTLTYSPVFSTLVFWTVKGKDFYCLEPWTAPRNALNTGEHLLRLEPKTSLEAEFRIRVSFL
jgi:galactose mutarotase-like enzyme